MAGLENYSMYSEDNPNDWEQILYQRKMNSLRLRPTELNLQPMNSVPKVVDEGPTPEEGISSFSIVFLTIFEHQF